MAQVLQTIDVNVPVAVSYGHWIRFDTFGQFLSFVDSVTPIDGTHHHWSVTIAGATREFDTEVVEQIVDDRVAWNSVGGSVDHAGVVTFHHLSNESSRLAVQIDWDPEGLLEKAGAALNIPDRAVQSALDDFKHYVEGSTPTTGTRDGWK